MTVMTQQSLKKTLRTPRSRRLNKPQNKMRKRELTKKPERSGLKNWTYLMAYTIWKTDQNCIHLEDQSWMEQTTTISTRRNPRNTIQRDITRESPKMRSWKRPMMRRWDNSNKELKRLSRRKSSKTRKPTKRRKRPMAAKPARTTSMVSFTTTTDQRSFLILKLL